MSDAAIIGATVVIGALVWFATARVPSIERSPGADADVVDGPREAGRSPGVLVSIVIAARNEEHDLALLLADLAELDLIDDHDIGDATDRAGRGDDSIRFELIVVDDGSTDATAALAAAGGARVIPAEDRPPSFNPKIWALDIGARAARGDILLFLDADIRITPDAVRDLVGRAHAERALVSVVPRHLVASPVESFSALCNVIMAIGAGPGLGRRDQGAVGSTIAISRDVYWAIGGHAASPATIVDDLALAAHAKRAGVALVVFRGGSAVTTRMYDGGIASIWNGWTKNFAAGARYAGAVSSVVIALWLATLVMPLALLIQGRAVLAGSLWLIVAAMTFATTRLVGRFNPMITSLGAPVLGVFVSGITAMSVVRRITGATVDWKGRDLTPSGVEERR